MGYAARDIADNLRYAAPPALPGRRAGGAASDVVGRLESDREVRREAVAALPGVRGAARGPAGRWSAAEVVEHLALTEWAVVEFVRGTLLTWPRHDPAIALPTDHEVLRASADRAVRLDAPERLRPVGDGARPAALCAGLEAARDTAIALAVAHGDALRTRTAPHPHFGLLDGAQWLLFLAGHAERHAVQLHELAARRRPAAA
ncbi:DinB family protein [Roseisolibacter sp. H3M3-2]|uniref:DinB family protein n=1 Tax=Roseisolibacter sp. H3M3-2 TaxID=3031323 RepID=UPI0023DA1423|nr:DinB family protein [Roseisolibacter sp. H3M3-2]MDF1504185.1 DinB family protein [Roseisolibacter sp. H3M3-2]